MKSITCTCDNIIEADFKDRYDAEKDDNLLESILEGDFLSVTCGECGKLLKPEIPVRITGKNPPLDIYFVPERSGTRSSPEKKPSRMRTGSS
ncbi:MAG: CpXC domain-containing protein [Spirochaetia bacterium]